MFRSGVACIGRDPVLFRALCALDQERTGVGNVRDMISRPSKARELVGAVERDPEVDAVAARAKRSIIRSSVKRAEWCEVCPLPQRNTVATDVRN